MRTVVFKAIKCIIFPVLELPCPFELCSSPIFNKSSFQKVLGGTIPKRLFQISARLLSLQVLRRSLLTFIFSYNLFHDSSLYFCATLKADSKNRIADLMSAALCRMFGGHFLALTYLRLDCCEAQEGEDAGKPFPDGLLSRFLEEESF